MKSFEIGFHPNNSKIMIFYIELTGRRKVKEIKHGGEFNLPSFVEKIPHAYKTLTLILLLSCGEPYVFDE